MSKVGKFKNQPFVFIPLMASKILGLDKGSRVIIYIDLDEKTLIIKPVEIELGSKK